MYCGCTHRGSPRVWHLRTHRAVEAYMPFWTKETEMGIWDFTEEGGSSHVDEKEQTCDKGLPGHPETVEHQGECNRQTAQLLAADHT